MENTYNGWTNYETWNFMLWEGGYLHDVIADRIEFLDEGEKLTYGDIYELVDSHIDGMLEMNDIPTQGMFADILGAAINDIDIHDAAQSLAEDFADYMEEE